MTAFRYEAIGGNGAAVKGVIEAEDRKAALQLLGERGLFPSGLEICSCRSGIHTPWITWSPRCVAPRVETSSS